MRLVMNKIDRNKLNPNKVVGFTAGNFDLLHPGYIYIIRMYNAPDPRRT